MAKYFDEEWPKEEEMLNIGLKMSRQNKADRQKVKRVFCIGNGESRQGFDLDKTLSDDVKNEIAWGSQLFLTATPAATILIYWDEKVILRRGLISSDEFMPGETCYSVLKKQQFNPSKFFTRGRTKVVIKSKKLNAFCPRKVTFVPTGSFLRIPKDASPLLVKTGLVFCPVIRVDANSNLGKFFRSKRDC